MQQDYFDVDENEDIPSGENGYGPPELIVRVHSEDGKAYWPLVCSRAYAEQAGYDEIIAQNPTPWEIEQVDGTPEDKHAQELHNTGTRDITHTRLPPRRKPTSE